MRDNASQKPAICIWRTVANPQALERAGVADAAPGMTAILDVYVTTIPRVLTLVASSAI